MQLGMQLRRALALAAAGAAFTAIVAATPEASSARSACRGGTAQLFRDGAVRVYRQGTARTYACLFANGRRSRLPRNAMGFRRAGKYLAYFAYRPRNALTNRRECVDGVGGCLVRIASTNLRSGRIVWSASLVLENQLAPAVRGLVLRSADGKFGAVVGSGADTKVIRPRGLGGYRKLDAGAGIAPESLSATSSRLSWSNGGVIRSAPLGPRDTTPEPRSHSCTVTAAPTLNPYYTTPEYFDEEIAVIYAQYPRTSKTIVCRFRTGRRFTLPDFTSHYQRTGNFLLHAGHPGCGEGPDTVPLQSRSLIDGRVIARASVRIATGCLTIQTVLRGSDGAFAYILDPLGGQPVRVVAVRRTGSQVLDPGPGVEFGSLTLSGSTLTWRNAGAQRTATL
jgi:hypothetical protein